MCSPIALDTGDNPIHHHPDNPRHPAHWRVDGQRGINPAPCLPDRIELAVGERMRHRYRLILHDGTLSPERINGLFADYAQL